ncbi:MAG: UDP-N-acetylmuramoyl-tripeptide--D-alanyl-D-alanine ligase [Syntrophobacterales bacterium]|jgi:UDP-N-acetylmuramoyl-tripeptide--D-alanyl-D-alanine ligase|nr:UDP-N-acetylmuramoyl-tripeptide--D-alanyl-D-alanine ligase [Syntrophobacterales bacterium]
MWRVDDVVEAVCGVPLRIEKDMFVAVSTDSRTIGVGDLFVPLPGANFDGHLYINDAYETSLGGSICEKRRVDICRGGRGTVILVDDTTQALLDLARWKKERMAGRCIALTGSNGKTTTKEILVDMMKRSFVVAYNEKNFNNLIGVSKNILAIAGEPEVLIYELGTNNKGEIQALATTTQPDLSLITNINASHLEGLSDLEGVLEEKLDLFRFTKSRGKVLVNADDPHIMRRYRDAGREALLYGITNEADFRLNIDKDLGWEGSEITITFPGESLTARTRLLGRHNLYNILAASALAYSAGLGAKEIKETVETFGAFSMRFTAKQSERGFMVIDDTYNANPASVEWAVRTIEDLPCRGKRVAILGDMRELGEKTAFYHRELGRFLKTTSIRLIALVGEYVKETFDELGNERAILFEDKERLVNYVNDIMEEGDVVLVKGSRAARMEEIVGALA